MEPLALVCAVYDIGAVFRVSIAREEDVMALQKTILEARRDMDVRFRGVNPAAMALFVARERGNSVWLKDDRDLDAFLQCPVSDLYEKMRPTLPLSRSAYFGETAKPLVSGVVHILVKLPPATVSELEQLIDTRMWRVSGSIPNVPGIEGVRDRLNRLARKLVGYYDPAVRNGGQDRVFWYDGAMLRYCVLFPSDYGAMKFLDGTYDEAKMLGHPPKVWRDTKCISRVPPPALLEQLKRVRHTLIVQEEEMSPWVGLDATGSSRVSTVDVSSDEFHHQRIEREHLFVPYGLAESCRLMPHSQCYQERVAIGDDANNQLALSRDMRGWFDGIACKVPIVNIRAGAVEVAPSVDNRYKVELLVNVLDEKCASRVFSRLKAGSVTTDDPLVMKTFVHVLDPTTFVRCLRFKYEENEARWAYLLGI